MISEINCPYCDQQLHGVVPDGRIPRVRAKLLISLKEEIYSGLDARTSWGKNQLKDYLDTIFDSRLEDI